MGIGSIIMLIGGFLFRIPWHEAHTQYIRRLGYAYDLRYHGGGVGHCRSTGAVALNEVDDLAASVPTITEECQENDGEPLEAQVADKGERVYIRPQAQVVTKPEACSKVTRGWTAAMLTDMMSSTSTRVTVGLFTFSSIAY